MNDCERVSVIIPSLNPTDKLERVVTGLIEAGFPDIIVVNDGSDAEHAAPFERIGEIPECTVLTHPHNMGKGAALKTAFSYFLSARSGKAGVVTVDGDGQHLRDDVVKCAMAMTRSGEAIVLGARDFLHSGAPMRNSIGNRVTAFAFRALFGIKLRDTQTGLRGIPAAHVPLLLEIRGARFEFETNMLLEFKQRNIPFHEEDIATVYDEKASEYSHYRPFVDSAIIFTRIIKYAMSSVISFVADIGAFWLALRLLRDLPDSWIIFVCTAIARVISSFINFNINRRLVFRRSKSFGSHFIRYYTLAAAQMLASAGGLWLLALLFGGTRSAGLLTLLKALIDTLLFFVSYYIQCNWVFTA